MKGHTLPGIKQSPAKKALVGAQGNLPKELKEKIKAAPEKGERKEPTYEGTDEYRKEKDIPTQEFLDRGVKPPKKSPTKMYGKKSPAKMYDSPNKMYGKKSPAKILPIIAGVVGAKIAGKVVDKGEEMIDKAKNKFLRN